MYNVDKSLLVCYKDNNNLWRNRVWATKFAYCGMRYNVVDLKEINLIVCIPRVVEHWRWTPHGCLLYLCVKHDATINCTAQFCIYLLFTLFCRRISRRIGWVFIDSWKHAVNLPLVPSANANNSVKRLVR